MRRGSPVWCRERTRGFQRLSGEGFSDVALRSGSVSVTDADPGCLLFGVYGASRLPLHRNPCLMVLRCVKVNGVLAFSLNEALCQGFSDTMDTSY